MQCALQEFRFTTHGTLCFYDSMCSVDENFSSHVHAFSLSYYTIHNRSLDVPLPIPPPTLPPRLPTVLIPVPAPTPTYSSVHPLQRPVLPQHTGTRPPVLRCRGRTQRAQRKAIHRVFHLRHVLFWEGALSIQFALGMWDFCSVLFWEGAV
jgi:hypothetical protein